MHICIVADAILGLHSPCVRPCHNKKRGRTRSRGSLRWSDRPPYARITGCNAQFFQQRECPGLLQGQARRQGRAACFGVKCHKACERNLLNHKKDVSNAPRDANYPQNSPCNIRTVILPSDSKGQRFESSRAHQLIEIPSVSCRSTPNLAMSHAPIWRASRMRQSRAAIGVAVSTN